MRSNSIMLGLAPLVLIAGLSACVLPTSLQVGNSAIEVEGKPRPNAVCNPFGSGDPNIGSDHGLIANLFYVPAGARTYDNVADYQTHGTKLDATLYFNQLNVPTRPFDQGFMTQDGTVLKTPNGDTLYEYFSVHFESVLKLSNHEQPGRYQFALLADDGAVLQIKDTRQGWFKLVDDDGTHPSRLACADEGIDLDYNSRLPIKVDYYQGPRYHIALMLLWRKLPDGNQCFSDAACGLEGNDQFFDSTHTPSVAQPTWISMLSRGWHVLGAENYLLPLDSALNPCTTNPGPLPSPSASPSPAPSASPTPAPSPVPSASPIPVS
jgi:hypothetical protein